VLNTKAMNKLTYQKAGINFTLSFERGISIVIEANCLFKEGDSEFNEKDKKVKTLHSGYQNGALKIVYGGYLLVGGKKLDGIKIDDESVRMQIEKWIADDKQKVDDDKADRESHRPSPCVDTEMFVLYNVGCDTGLIYPEIKRSTIELALKNGAKPIPVLRGERDKTNKYPGQMDAHIDVSYATKIDGKWTAPGYEYIYEDLYCIPVEDYNTAKAVIDAETNAKKEAADKSLQDAFERARTTGEPVLISKIVVPEEESPLKNDGEGDMVDICKFAMPDGSIQEKCFHNY
jgi:hypothetical protein